MSPGRARAATWSATADQDGSNTTLLRRQRHCGRNERAGHAGHRVLAGGVDLHHDHLVGEAERVAELGRNAAVRL